MMPLPSLPGNPILSPMVVITGASGHLGNTLVRAFLGQGRRVRAVLRRPDPPSLAGLDVERVEGDLFDERSLESAFAGAEVVIHAAALISTMNRDRADLERTNIQGTRNVIEAALAAGVGRVVYVSSVEALDLHRAIVSDSQEDGFLPQAALMTYGRTKALATLAVLEAVRKRALPAVVVAPSGIIGPFDFGTSLTGRLVRRFIHRRLPGYLDGRFDFVDVRDAAAGVMSAAERGKAGSWYLLSGTLVSLPDLMELLAEVSGVPKPFLKVPPWLAIGYSAVGARAVRIAGGTPLYTPNSVRILQTVASFHPDRAAADLGYVARPLRETLADTVAWWRKREGGAHGGAD